MNVTLNKFYLKKIDGSSRISLSRRFLDDLDFNPKKDILKVLSVGGKLILSKATPEDIINGTVR